MFQNTAPSKWLAEWHKHKSRGWVWKNKWRKYNGPLNGACQPGELKQKSNFESMSSNKVEWQIPVIWALQKYAASLPCVKQCSCVHDLTVTSALWLPQGGPILNQQHYTTHPRCCPAKDLASYPLNGIFIKSPVQREKCLWLFVLWLSLYSLATT